MCLFIVFFFLFFFFKQKTAYEMRISDWSSDVCSSDLDLRYDGEGDRGSDDRDDQPAMPHDDALDIAQLQIVHRGVGGALLAVLHGPVQIGRASCRERVCKYV